MENRQRVTLMQLEVLWEYLNSNKEIASGYNRSAAARANYQTMWQSVAEVLNSFGEGAMKDPKSWAKYWVDYKSKLKRRVKEYETNGEELMDIEKKFLLLISDKKGTSPFGVHVKSEKHESTIGENLNYNAVAVEPAEETSNETGMDIIARDHATQEEHDGKNIVQPIEICDAQCDEVGSGGICSDDGAASVVGSPSSEIRGRAASVASRKVRRRRRIPVFTAEAARRELINISRVRADTEARNTIILEKMVDIWQGIQQSLTRIEARLSEANTRR